MFHFLLFCFSLSLVNIIFVEVAHLTHALRVKRLIQVLAFMGSLRLSNLVIAVAAHIFCNFYTIIVWANVWFWWLNRNIMFFLADLFIFGAFYQPNKMLNNLDKHDFMLLLALFIFFFGAFDLLKHIFGEVKN